MPWRERHGGVRLVMIDSQGEPMEVLVPPGEDPVEVEREMWRFLADEDPT